MRCLEPVRIPIKKDGEIEDYISVPCGKCEVCQQKYKDRWAYRNLLELACNDKACMLTLTFSDEGLEKHNEEYPDIPKNSVYKVETDLWLKRFRKSLDCKIRYFGVSEYGEKSTCRPHYHFIIYGIDCDHPLFDGKQPVMRQGRIHHYYIYDGISSWRYGQVEVSADKVTAQAVTYMLKYFTKQFSRQYDNLLKGRLPLFMTYSRRPGIGYYGIEKFKQQLVRDGFGLLGSKKISFDRYIVEKLEKLYPDVDIKEMFKMRIAEYVHTHPQKEIDVKQYLINKKKGKR